MILFSAYKLGYSIESPAAFNAAKCITKSKFLLKVLSKSVIFKISPKTKFTSDGNEVLNFEDKLSKIVISCPASIKSQTT